MEIRIGTLSFQSNDREDVFAVADVVETGFEPSEEQLTGIEDFCFESSSPWLNGEVPQMQPVAVDGDTTLIRAWFRGERSVSPFDIRVYIEYEEVEERIEGAGGEAEREEEDGNGEDCLKQREVFL